MARCRDRSLPNALRRSRFDRRDATVSGMVHYRFLFSPAIIAGMPQSAASPEKKSIMPGQPVYKRVLLKISGEGFCHEGGQGIEAAELQDIARQCVEVSKMGVELA